MERKLVQRMISLMFAITFLGLLFSGGISEYDNRLCKASSDTAINYPFVYRIFSGCAKGIVIFYYFITSSTEKPVRRDENISNDDNTDKQKH